MQSTPALAEEKVKRVEMTEEERRGKGEKPPGLPVKKGHIPTRLPAEKQTTRLQPSFSCSNNTRSNKENNLQWVE